MNIFYLDKNPRKAAEMMCDKHIVKMILETGQILSTVHREYGNDDERLYKATHKHHPSTKWAGKNWLTYDWTYQHFVALNDEYWFRYGKDHLTFKKLNDLVWRCPRGMKMGVFEEPPQAMPDDCKIDGDSVAAYRLYYATHKKGFAKWTRRNKPEWMMSNQELSDCNFYI